MLASLSRHSTRWFDVRMEGALSSCEDEQMFSVDVNLTNLLLSPDLSWSGIMHFYGRGISPVYRSLCRVVEEDIENVTRLLLELDPQPQESEDKAPSPNSLPPPNFSSEHVATSCPDGHFERPRRKRRKCSRSREPLVIRPSDPLLPTIVITPCPSQSRETSCWVPYQDASFGGRLTIPTYTALNSTHPPMTDFLASASRLDKWEYVDGHWTAVIPPPDEQCRRGMYSKVAVSRKKSRTRTIRDCWLFIPS